MQSAVRSRAPLSILLPFLACFASCPPPPGNSDPQQLELSYTENPMRIWAGAPAPSNPPELNFACQDFTIAPALPDGLEFDGTRGEIFGTATAASPQSTFEVKAIRDGAELTRTNVSILVFDPIAPGSLTYTPDSVSVPAGNQFAPMVAQFAGVAQSFTVVPPLPSQVSINPVSGTITGALFGVPSSSQHVVTVSNPLGSAQATVQFEVTDSSLHFNGLLVPSANDGTLDVFTRRGGGFIAVDAEHCSGGSPLDAVATLDGRFAYAIASNNRLYGLVRDLVRGTCAPPVELEVVPTGRKLAITPDQAYLLVAGNGFVKRFELQPDGSLCCGVQVAGPASPSAMLATSNDLLLVGASFPGEVWCFDTQPSLALRGSAVGVGQDRSVNDFANSAPGVRVIAATNTYDIMTHEIQGALLDLRISTNAQLAGGMPAVVQTHATPVGESLVDGELDLSVDNTLLVVDSSLGRVYSYDVNASGSLIENSFESTTIGGNPSRVLRAGPSGFPVILDSLRGEISCYVGDLLSAGPLSIVRTRGFPSTMIALGGDSVAHGPNLAFVTSAPEASVRAVRVQPAPPYLLEFSPQGPVATGAGPVAVAVDSARSRVYTADKDGGTISAFAFDSGSMQLSLIEHAVPMPGIQPVSLAVAPGGGFLFALDALGNVISMTIDPADGSLDLSGLQPIDGSMAEAFLRLDKLARFAWVVQPAEGRIKTLRLAVGTGAPSPSTELLALTDPTDLLVSLDGRTVCVLDRTQAEIGEYAIDPFDGALTATGETFGIGSAPLRLDNRRSTPTMEFSQVEPLMVFDAQHGSSTPLLRNQMTGVMQPSGFAATLFLPGTDADCVVRHAFGGDGFLGASGSSANGLLTLYYAAVGQSSPQPTDSQPIGDGPHALAALLEPLGP